ncbi:hypothetical protein HMPREF9098_1659 [Kingella denitrificans ATCC 33394]|uniref:Uncharacterized protein n=1 Tax=Kingella denitrificans ATCC 33394 TaxID=888741 RepID=F0F0M4_9NEIS|nr:hypothetical protein HMPREF9098_1659 [Kingella denitrificans ATCC 33394]
MKKQPALGIYRAGCFICMRQTKEQAAFKAWVWRRNAMNAVKSSLHIRLRKPEKCGGGAFVFRQRQAGTRLPFLWRGRRIIIVINKNRSHRNGKQ